MSTIDDTKMPLYRKAYKRFKNCFRSKFSAKVISADTNQHQCRIFLTYLDILINKCYIDSILSLTNHFQPFKIHLSGAYKQIKVYVL